MILDNIVGIVSFSISKLFSNASNDIKSCCNGELNLSCNNFIGFTIVLSSFRVTKNNPFKTKILNLGGSDFSSVGTVSSSRGILDGNLDVLLNIFKDPRNMNCNRSNYDIYFSRVKIKLVKDIVNEVSSLSKSVVGFPVSTDQESSESHWIRLRYLI